METDKGPKTHRVYVPAPDSELSDEVNRSGFIKDPLA